MAWTPTKTIGLAFYEGKILAAELTISGPRRLVSRMAAFPFPDKVGLGDPAALGKAFAQFLRAKEFSAKVAVIGLPMHRILTKEQKVPPAEGEVLASILRIQAERAFSYDGKALSVDYVPQDAVGTSRSVLLFAVLRENVDQVMAFAAAAGLKVAGITSSGAVLALAGAGAAGPAVELVLQAIPGSVELAVQSNQKLRALRAVSAPQKEGVASPVWVEALSSELRRVMAAATNETGWGSAGRLVVWDGVGLPADAAETISRRLSIEAGECRGLSALAELNGAFQAGPETSQFAAAVALARAALDPSLLAVDFLHSRLAPPRRARLDWKTRFMIIVGAAALLVVAFFAGDWYLTSGAVSSLRSQIDELAPTAKAAETLIREVETADGWFGNRPQCLECLLQVSKLFPEDGKVWATELLLPDDMRGILSGKATDDRSILDVFNRLQESLLFTDVKLHGGIRYPRETARDRDLSFSISFRFKKSR